MAQSRFNTFALLAVALAIFTGLILALSTLSATTEHGQGYRMMGSWEWGWAAFVVAGSLIMIAFAVLFVLVGLNEAGSSLSSRTTPRASDGPVILGHP